MRKAILFLLVLLCLLLDIYVYGGIKVLTSRLHPHTREIVWRSYWGFTVVLSVAMLLGSLRSIGSLRVFFRRFSLASFFVNVITKLFSSLFLLLDDILRGGRWIIYQVLSGLSTTPSAGTGIARSIFLTQTAMYATTVPLVVMSYGIVSGAYDYRVRRVTVRLAHLPRSFHGLRIGQISDIHCGSFLHKKAVKRGVEILQREKADILFFTGDLVNDTAEEAYAYIDVFGKLTAPLGIFSVLGNHDYGDYVRWTSLKEKNKNHQAMYAVHQQLGWHLLMNEHVMITQGGEQLAVIGVENWGTGGFSQYGRLGQACVGTENTPVKLLLSHDPSHWDAQVRPYHSDIDITFSGHTHGGQFGVEVGSLKWSLVKYRYKRWAGLYQAGTQYLYVNRGYGCTGYPGRIGILPEITIMELTKA